MANMDPLGYREVHVPLPQQQAAVPAAAKPQDYRTNQKSKEIFEDQIRDNNNQLKNLNERHGTILKTWKNLDDNYDATNLRIIDTANKIDKFKPRVLDYLSKSKVERNVAKGNLNDANKELELLHQNLSNISKNKTQLLSDEYNMRHKIGKLELTNKILECLKESNIRELKKLKDRDPQLVAEVLVTDNDVLLNLANHHPQLVYDILKNASEDVLLHLAKDESKLVNYPPKIVARILLVVAESAESAESKYALTFKLLLNLAENHPKLCTDILLILLNKSPILTIKVLLKLKEPQYDIARDVLKNVKIDFLIKNTNYTHERINDLLAKLGIKKEG